MSGGSFIRDSGLLSLPVKNRLRRLVGDFRGAGARRVRPGLCRTKPRAVRPSDRNCSPQGRARRPSRRLAREQGISADTLLTFHAFDDERRLSSHLIASVKGRFCPGVNTVTYAPAGRCGRGSRGRRRCVRASRRAASSFGKDLCQHMAVITAQ